MNKHLEKIIELFQAADNLAIFIYNKNGQLIKQTGFKKLSEEIKNKIFEHLNEKVFLASSKEGNLIAAFKNGQERLVISTISKSINTELKTDEQNLKIFSAKISIFYMLLKGKQAVFQKENENLKNIVLFNKMENDSLISRSKKPSYDGYISEQKMLKGIEHGNLNEFDKNFSKFAAEGNFGVLSNNELRNKKNIVIAAITLYTRSSIKGGLYVQSAYDLSDYYIQRAERQTHIEDLHEYIRSIGKVFVKNVSAVKRKNEPTLIYQTQEYIYDHLASIKNIDEIASKLNCSSSYLMHLFKKTTGKSIVSFITEQKISSAKQQLLFSKKSLNQIAHQIGYKRQSDFSRSFKKIVGRSPSRFRSSQKI
ncbi:helix-turn-helix domain-containing protein [Oenococcus alcoholitolerans]|uniref:AraC family transcriptional regulator n=1 Tax=Oenococcus alcoholitolerans TaxID=931074 RepID=UPI003F7109B5